MLHGGQPPHLHAFLDRLLDLEVVRGHPVSGPPVDHDRVGRAQPLRGTGDVHRRVTAADDCDAAAEQRLLLALHAAQHRHRVQDVRGLAGWDVGPPADVGADGEERGVEAAGLHLVRDVAYRPVQLERHAHIEDARNLGVKHVPGEPVLRDAIAHHPAGRAARVEDGDLMPQHREVVGGRQPGGAGSDDQDLLAGRRGIGLDGPALLDGLVPEEPLHRVDADGGVELGPVADRLARVVADPSHDRREGVVQHDLVPGAVVPVAALLALVQPLLDVLACRAGVVARW